MQEKKKIEMERVSKLFETPEYSVLASPTKKVVKYIMEMEESGEYALSVRATCDIAGADKHRVGRKLQKVRNGHPYDQIGRPPIINEQESKLLEEVIMQAIERRDCKTASEIAEIARKIVSERTFMALTGKTISTQTIKRWLEAHGFILSKPLSTYAAKAKSDQETMTKMYKNLHLLCQIGQYPDSLIFNMDESWVSTEKKQAKGHVAHTEDTPPIALQAAYGKHVTIIVCISKIADAVTPVYILPEEVNAEGLNKTHGLQGLKYYYQRSGFMTGDIMARWLVDHFIPHVNTIRGGNVNQHALLICDAHVSRRNNEVCRILKDNNIDMLVLPAHVTSVVQPLDIGVFALYKEHVRKHYKGTGGLYSLLYASAAAFRIATNCITLDSAWKESKLFTTDWKEFVKTFPQRELIPPKRKSKRLTSNYIVTSFNLESLAWL